MSISWPHSNEPFVPATEQRIPIYVRSGCPYLDSPGLGLSFINIPFRTRKPQCAMPAAFFNGVAAGKEKRPQRGGSAKAVFGLVPGRPGTIH
jgi:hypothetical protein